MLRRLWVFGVVSCLFAAPAGAARRWTAIDVPGARCGDGSPYQVQVSRGDPRKIAVALAGGGACWSFETCYGPKPRAWLHRVPVVFETDGFFSNDPARSPAAGHTMVYFPYCTGDAHLGDHVANYLGARGAFGEVHHWGRRNVELGIRHLQQTGLVDFHAAEAGILYGASAGAIGTLYHAFLLDTAFERATSRTLLVDAPGLHFGATFWKKFSTELLHDFESAFDRAGKKLEPSHGNVAGIVPAICRLLPRWNVGVLQGSRDAVMTTVFGDIAPDEHERLIFGPEGLFALTLNPTDNCAAWVPTTATHMFLTTRSSARLKTTDGMSATAFAFALVAGRPVPNHR